MVLRKEVYTMTTNTLIFNDLQETLNEKLELVEELTDDYLEKKLVALPELIYKQEERIIKQKEEIAQAKLALQKKEASLLTSGVVDGKNKEIRDAQLLTLTQAEINQLTEAENVQQQQLIVLNYLNNIFSSYRAIARLRSRGD